MTIDTPGNLTELRTWFDEHVIEAAELGDRDYVGYKDSTHIDLLRDLARMISGNGISATSITDIPPAPLPQVEGMDLIPYCATDGEIEGFMLICWTKHDFGACQLIEWDETTEDREAEGVEGGWAIVVALSRAWLKLVGEVTTNIPKVEITSELSKPTRCRVWIGDTLQFDGLDQSASMTVDDLVGIAPDWTGGKSPEEYVSEQRDRGNDQH